jgi:anti-sigma factor (TIGR02949 family)
MDCNSARTHLDAYVDRELDMSGTSAIDQHLASCEACDAVFSRQARLRRALREHVTYHDAPPALAARIRARTMGATPARSSKPWSAYLPRLQWMQVGAAVAATAVLSWTAGVQYASLSEDELVAGQVMAGHVRSMLTSHLTDVATSDQHTVKPWFNGKVPFGVPVSDFAASGFPLVGGRLDYVGGRAVAALVYRRRNHLVNAFVWPEAAASAPTELAQRGYAVLHFGRGGLAWWLVSDASPADLRELQGLLAELR